MRPYGTPTIILILSTHEVFRWNKTQYLVKPALFHRGISWLTKENKSQKRSIGTYGAIVGIHSVAFFTASLSAEEQLPINSMSHRDISRVIKKTKS